MSQMLEIYAILVEVSTMPVSPTPEQVGRLWAQAGFQVELLKMRLDRIKGDVGVEA
jgi:hypothetical protein